MIIDLGNINSVQELHLKFKTALHFSEEYGMNWVAFWEAISSQEDMPEELILINWKSLEMTLPSDAEKLRQLIIDFNHLGKDSEIAIEQVY